MKQTFLLLLFSCLFAVFSNAQVIELKGKVADESTSQPLEGVTVTAAGVETTTDAYGEFMLKPRLRGGDLVVSFYKEGFISIDKAVELKSHQTKVDIGTVRISHEPTAKDFVTDEDRIPIISLTGEDDGSRGDQNISGILSASRDPFVNAASFNLSTGGFEIRGYDAETPTLFNGILVNNLETGSVYWSTWGGLNDVTRNRESTIDLSPSAYSFGGVGGAAAIDTRASEQRTGKRVSYMYGNRSYTGRVMATWNTGMLANGWAFSFSGSRRWAEEGYVPGTFYDAWSYFGSIDKKLSRKHMLNLTVIGSPVRRGAQSPSVQEMNDLAGTNFYNPNWGWQDGRKRNARVVDAHQPFGVLRHDWTISEKSTLTTAIGYMTGHYGRTQLDWFNSPDPRPDYYRKLPSYYTLPGNGGLPIANQVAEIYRNNPDLLQVQWDEIYEGNRLNGQSYNNTPGNMSQVVLADQRSDLNRLSANTIYNNIISDHLTINAGVQFQQERTHYFAKLQDLLGGDYFVNVDRFALDTPLPGQSPEFDLNNPDPIVREGDAYRWDYDITGRRTGSWLQGLFTFGRIDFFVAGEVTNTTFWRTGNFRNGRYPNSSFGDSEKQNFFNYSGKAGVTYKINGRNYLYANGAYVNRAPDIRNSYVSARSRDQLVPGLTSEEIFSGEIGYQLRSPRLKGRATFFLTDFNNGLKINRFFLDDDVSGFGTSILVGTDKRHAGVEVAAQYKISSTISFTGVASVGEYIYTSRPTAIFVIDDDGVIQNRGRSYLKNFYIPSTPQTAYSGSLEYRSPNFWSASVTVNYFDRNYIDVNPFRRTTDAVFGDQVGDANYNRKIDQERLPSAYTVDLFANKSYKLNDDVFFNLTLGVTNLLNATFRTGGFEQLRFDKADFDRGINLFAPRYFYAYGTNFFLLGALRF